jgi:hypothetical protein
VRPLKEPILALLDRSWKRPRQEYTGIEQRITVDLAAVPIVMYSTGAKDKHQRITGARSKGIIELAKSIYGKCEPALRGTLFSVYMTGESLESFDEETEAPGA